MILPWALLISAALAFLSVDTACAEQHRCANGAYVDNVILRCDLFKKFRAGNNAADPRLALRLHLDGKPQRSIAVIVGISDYPGIGGSSGDISNHKLEAAAEDLINLKKFFIENQDFDEVISLENGEATEDSIHYFLGKYLIRQALNYAGKTRFVFAYSGHGLQEDKDARLPARLVLSAATSEYDLENEILLSSISNDLRELSRVSFHVLGLINACYGGAVFSYGPTGGSQDDTSEPGSWAVTAGPDDKEVWSTGEPGGGSLFFHAIVSGVETGDADTGYAQVRRSVDDKILQQGGVVRLGHLVVYLGSKFQDLKDAHPSDEDTYHLPWSGPIQEEASRARGGFFFMSPYKLAPGIQKPFAVQPGATSGVTGSPDLQVFNSPDEYKIQGVDISHYNKVDWSKLKKGEIQFVYMKASQGSNFTDPNFIQNWAKAGELGIARGAYHFFDYCAPPETQFELLKQTIPNDTTAMPVAIDFEPPYKEKDKVCSQQIEMKGRLLKLLNLTEDFYKKAPVLFRIKSDMKMVPLDDRFLHYPLWISQTAKSEASFGVSSPWTIWQTGTYQSAAFGDVDRDVFFGQKQDFDAFIKGTPFVALNAVVKSPPQIMIPVPRVVCTGEFEQNCPGPHQVYIGCPNRNWEDLSLLTCGGRRGRITPLVRGISGNQCGYSLLKVECS